MKPFDLVRPLLGAGIGSRLRRGVMGAGMVWALRMLATFGVSVVFGRALGASGYGEYAYAVAWIINLSSLGNMGYGVLAARELAAARGRGEEGLERATVRHLSHAVLWRAAIVSTLFVIGSVAYNLATDRGLTLIVALQGISILLFSQMSLYQGALRGSGFPTRAQFLPHVAIPGANLLIFGFLLLVVDPTAIIALSGYTAALVFAVIFAFFSFRRSTQASSQLVPDTMKKHWRKISFTLGLSALAATTNEQVPVLMLGTFSSSTDAGLFDIARRFSMLASIALSMINIPLGPLVSELYARGEIEKLTRIARRSTLFCTAASLGVTAVFAIFGRQLLGLVETDFEAAYIGLLILCAGHVISNASGPVALVLTMTKHETAALQGMTISIVLNVIVTASLIPNFGYIGGAIGSAVSLSVWNIILAFKARRRLGFSIHIFSRPTLLKEPAH